MGELEGSLATIVNATRDAAATTCTANIKVWPMIMPNGQLRVMIINKDADAACDVRVRAAGAYQQGSVLARPDI